MSPRVSPTAEAAGDGSSHAAGPAEDTWRGVAAEHADVTHHGSLRLKRRSRALLKDLLRPSARTVWLLVAVVLVEHAARLSIPLLVQRGIDLGIPPLVEAGDARALLSVVALMLGALLVQGLSRRFFLRRSGRVGQNVLLDLRRRVFRHFQHLDVAFHEKYTSGRVVSRLTSDIDAIAELLVGGFDGLIKAALTMVGVGVLLVTLDLRLGTVCLLGFPILLLLVRWFSRASSRIYRRVRETSAMTIVHFVESMNGIRAVQAYRREPRNQELFTDLAGRYRDANIESFRLIGLFMPGVRLIGNLTIGIALLFGGWLVIQGSMTIGVLTAFLLYLRMFFEPMQEISQFYNTFQSASSALEKLSGVLEERPAVREPDRPRGSAAVAGRIDIERVGFGYTDDRPVLPGLTLHIPAGQTVALVGTTGAGKTTVAKLLARFYDPTSGRISVDGTDLREFGDAELRRSVVMVTQENVMFAGSVADNIGLGRPEASRRQIEAAAAAVGADVFIRELPHGYDTEVGQRSRLSAGQRQLVAFARAFLADPAVLILDEATSSLDIPSERLVQHALRTVLAKRTAVIIAHRLSTVEIADRVLVLEHGRILEDGPPKELLTRRDGRYAALHRAWEDSLA